MKFEIKNFSDSVLFVAELEARFETESAAVRLGAAVKVAVKAGARLEGARLEGARLEGARLEGAWLQGARLEGAWLEGAWLQGARLEGARLEGAWLQGARLQGAWLQGARLEGAWLEGAWLEGAWLQGARLGDLVLVGRRPFFQIGPIGSRNDYLCAFLTDKGVMIRAGCFFGSLDEFKAAVVSTHGTNEHAREYAAATAMIEAHAAVWTPAADKAAAE